VKSFSPEETIRNHWVDAAMQMACSGVVKNLVTIDRREKLYVQQEGAELFV